MSRSTKKKSAVGADRGDFRDPAGRFAKNNPYAIAAGQPGAAPGNRYRETHGLKAAQKRLAQWGNRALNRRSRVGKALAEWRKNLIADLGGEDAVSTQQKAIVEVCVKTKLLLDSVDVWLLQQKSLLHGKKKTLIPVVQQRNQLAENLSKNLERLGLQRRKVTKSLNEVLASMEQPIPIPTKPVNEGEE